MKRRYLLIVSIPVAFGCLALGVLAMLPPDDRPGVTKANFDRIEKGMTLAEVQQIFGQDGEGPWFTTEFKNRTYWYWDWPQVGIQFLDNCVIEKEWHNSNETILDKFRRWLHVR